MIFFSHFRRNPFVLFLVMFSMILCCGDAFISNSIESSHYNTQTRLLSLDATKSGGREIKTGEMYNDVVLSTTSSRPVLVFYTAPWCGPCRLTNPIVKDVMKQYSGKVDVVEVCTDDLADIAEQAGIVSIPTIQFYYKGEMKETIVGCVAKSVLANAVVTILDDVSQSKSTSS